MILKVPSFTSKGKFYLVDIIHRTCTCPVYIKTKSDCKHLTQVDVWNSSGDLSLDRVTAAEAAAIMGEVSHDKVRFNMTSSGGQAMYDLMEEFSRTRLSKNFIMRDFLHSNYNSVAGICNYPEKPEIVIAAGKKLCELVMEPIIAKWGRVFITFGYQCRHGVETANPNAKTKRTSSNPHQWDRGTFGIKPYARVDILPACVEDGGVSKREFGHWCMMNLDIDLMMMWGHSNVFCITIGPKPRRVWLEWVQSGKGENGSNKITYWGEKFWTVDFPKMLREKRPVFYPSLTDGKMYWGS